MGDGPSVLEEELVTVVVPVDGAAVVGRAAVSDSAPVRLSARLPRFVVKGVSVTVGGVTFSRSFGPVKAVSTLLAPSKAVSTLLGPVKTVAALGLSGSSGSTGIGAAGSGTGSGSTCGTTGTGPMTSRAMFRVLGVMMPWSRPFCRCHIAVGIASVTAVCLTHQRQENRIAAFEMITWTHRTYARSSFGQTQHLRVNKSWQLCESKGEQGIPNRKVHDDKGKQYGLPHWDLVLRDLTEMFEEEC